MIVTVILSMAVVLLGVAAVLALVRMSKGPSTLDRVVATDVVIATVVAALAIEAVLHRHTTTLPVILVLSLIGFAGSVSIAKFVADRDKAVKWNALTDRAKPGDRDDRKGDGR